MRQDPNSTSASFLNKTSNRSVLKRAAASACRIESLESRQMLTGTWTALSHAAPGGVETALQLSDGSVMVNGEGGSGASSSAWYKLTPVNGSYVNGTWTTLASMHYTRRFFGSVVLTSGKVMVMGGEYSSAGSDTGTAEIYDPVANSWANITSFPGGSFGDGNMDVLSDGRVLCSYLFSGQTYIYNPTTAAWSNGPTRLNGDSNSEETWVKLNDGSILSYEIQGSAPQTAQRFVLGATDAQNAWYAAGSVPVSLASNGGNTGIVPEEGPGFLLPDGRAYFVGATSNTAYYTPPSTTTGTGSWATGPTIPSSLGAFDAPGCVLPNGHVIFNAGAINGNTFAGPTTMFEVDPVANTIAAVSGTGVNLNVQPFETRMLMLPTGQVLLSNASTTMYAWTPSTGTGSAAWQPAITNITNDSGSNVFTLTGTQLNGISEGASYGDDAQMATDFPLVRLVDQAGNITYARTFNWTSTIPNASSSTVSFTLAPGQGLGAYLVSVVASGIASPAALEIQCGSASGENWIAQANANANYLDFNLIGSGVVATFALSGFSTLIMTGDAASNTLVVNDNLLGRNTVIDGGDGNDFLRVENDGSGQIIEYGGNGDDYFDFGFYGHNLSIQAGFADVYGGPGANSIFVYDTAYSAVTTYSVNSAQVSRAGFGGFFYDANFVALTVNTGTGAGDVVNVPSTFTGTPVYLYGDGTETINVGSGGSVQSIFAALTVEDAPSFLTLNVDDSADSTSRTLTLGAYTPAGDTPFGSLAGLAPAQINYEFADTLFLNLATGTGSANVVNVQNTGTVTTINGGAGTRTVNVGNPSQGVQGILGTLILNASSGNETVNLNDQQNGAGGTVSTLDNTVVNGYTSERISGLAPAVIEYYLSGTTALTIYSSLGGSNVVNLVTDSTPTSIIGSSSQGANDTVNLGVVGTNGILSGVTGAISVTNPTGFTAINVNDASDTISSSFTLSSYLQTGLTYGKVSFPTGVLFGSFYTFGTLTYARNDVSLLTINPGKTVAFTVQDTVDSTVINEQSGGSSPSVAVLTAQIGATTAALTINTTNDYWTLNLGSAGSMQSILGAISVTSSGFGSLGSIVADDSADVVARTVSISDSQITGLSPGVISYPQFRSQFNVSGGSGGNHIIVTTTPVGGLVPTNVLNSGNGNDVVTINATQASFSSGALVVNTGQGSDAVTVGAGSLSTFNSPVTVNGGSGNDTLLLADQTVAAADTYALTSTTVTRPNFSLTYSGLELLTLEAETGNNVINVNSTAVGTPVTVGANGGTDTINVNQTDPTAPVTIEPSAGSDAVNVDITGSSGATALFAASQQIGALTIGNGGVARVTTGSKKLLQANSVAASGTGVLDMTSNDLILHAQSIGSVNALVTSGLNLAAGGYWNGPGITSSSAATNTTFLTALGAVLNTTDGGVHTLFNAATPFDGVAPSLTDVLVKYTYYGDANLSGNVDGSDYSRIDANVGNGLTGWFNGDFNYSTKVDGSDYSLIDNAFNSQGALIAAAIAAPTAGPAGPVSATAAGTMTSPVLVKHAKLDATRSTFNVATTHAARHRIKHGPSQRVSPFSDKRVK